MENESFKMKTKSILVRAYFTNRDEENGNFTKFIKSQTTSCRIKMQSYVGMSLNRAAEMDVDN